MAAASPCKISPLASRRTTKARLGFSSGFIKREALLTICYDRNGTALEGAVPAWRLHRDQTDGRCDPIQSAGKYMYSSRLDKSACLGYADPRKGDFGKSLPQPPRLASAAVQSPNPSR